MGEIDLFQEEVDFTLKQKKQVRDWILRIVDSEKHSLVTINYIFCSDDYLINVNRNYLDHDTYTDIITFDHSTTSEEIEGDIFISIDRVKENATIQKTSVEQELHRVMIHGVLHLIGFSDHTPQQKKEMREKEDACLSLRQQ